MLKKFKFFFVLFCIACHANGDNRLIELIDNDLSIIESSIHESDNYIILDGMDIDFLNLENEVKATKNIYSHTYEYYSYSNEERDYLKNCMMGNIYNNFNLYGKYLSDYMSCIENKCENLGVIVKKIFLVRDDIKKGISACRTDLVNINNVK